MENKKRIHLHADDFGMNIESSERILQCYLKGHLDSVSIIPNGCCDEAFSLIRDLSLNVRIHINLVEGRCVSDKAEVPLLVNEKGYFKYSFVGLGLLLVSKRGKEAKKQIEVEIKNQIRKVCLITGKYCIGVDSHQHTHMIPQIFDAMCRAIEETGIVVNELRVPAEPLLPFLNHPSLYTTYKISNIMKNILLNMLLLADKKKIKKIGVCPSVFMGIMFSGHMDARRIQTILPDFVKIAERRETSLEILFHPGNILPEEKALDENKPLFANFYRSEGRQIEAQVLQSEEFYERLESVLEKTGK